MEQHTVGVDHTEVSATTRKVQNLTGWHHNFIERRLLECCQFSSKAALEKHSCCVSFSMNLSGNDFVYELGVHISSFGSFLLTLFWLVSSIPFFFFPTPDLGSSTELVVGLR